MSSEYHNNHHQQQLIHHNSSLIQNNYALNIILKIQPKQVPLMVRGSSSSSITILCNSCKSNLAEIFQVNGDYCMYCWQEITYPSI